MVMFICGVQQGLEIGEDVEITVEEIGPSEVRFGIHAPGQRVTRLDPVPLPIGSADLDLVHLESTSGWPHRLPRGEKEERAGAAKVTGSRQSTP